MATRFYLPSSGAAAVNPAFSSDWEDQSIGDRLRCVTTKSSTAMTTVSFADANNTDRDILFRQYVSDPLEGGQLIATSSLVICVMRIKERAVSCNMFLAFKARLFDITGGTLRAELTALGRDSVEASEVELTNRQQSFATSGNVTTSDGDRLVLEIGTAGDPTGGSDHDSDISIGDDSASDLPTDDSTTTPDNPWVQFPQTFTFWIPNKWSAVWPDPYPDRRLVSPY